MKCPLPKADDRWPRKGGTLCRHRPQVYCIKSSKPPRPRDGRRQTDPFEMSDPNKTAGSCSFFLVLPQDPQASCRRSTAPRLPLSDDRFHDRIIPGSLAENEQGAELEKVRRWGAWSLRPLLLTVARLTIDHRKLGSSKVRCPQKAYYKRCGCFSVMGCVGALR